MSQVLALECSPLPCAGEGVGGRGVDIPSAHPRPPLSRPDERLRRPRQHPDVPPRCAWRGIELDVQPVSLGDRLTPGSCDLIFFGGGQDREQAVISPDFVSEKGEAVREAVEDGAVVLAVCGGYQLLGHTYTTVDGQELPGAGVFDVRSVPGTRRHIGNLVAEVEPGRHAAHAGRLREPQRPDLPRAGLSRRWRRCSRAAATTARTAPRAPSTRTPTAATCTARCCPRTPGSPTG